MYSHELVNTHSSYFSTKGDAKKWIDEKGLKNKVYVILEVFDKR